MESTEMTLHEIADVLYRTDYAAYKAMMEHIKKYNQMCEQLAELQAREHGQPIL
jgi:hypothetical protein